MKKSFTALSRTAAALLFLLCGCAFAGEGANGGGVEDMGGSAVINDNPEGEKVTTSGRIKAIEPISGEIILTDPSGQDTVIRVKPGTAEKLLEGDTVSVTYIRGDENIATRVTKTRAGNNGAPGETRYSREAAGLQEQPQGQEQGAVQ